MATEATTQEIPRFLDGSGGGRHGVLPHDAVFATAMARIEAVTTSWQETLAGFATSGGSGRHAAPAEPAVPAVPAGTIPEPRTEADADAALAARAEASRWRRSLAA